MGPCEIVPVPKTSHIARLKKSMPQEWRMYAVDAFSIQFCKQWEYHPAFNCAYSIHLIYSTKQSGSNDIFYAFCGI